jgi:hypothetical protein
VTSLIKYSNCSRYTHFRLDSIPQIQTYIEKSHVFHSAISHPTRPRKNISLLIHHPKRIIPNPQRTHRIRPSLCPINLSQQLAIAPARNKRTRNTTLRPPTERAALQVRLWEIRVARRRHGQVSVADVAAGVEVGAEAVCGDRGGVDD